MSYAATRGHTGSAFVRIVDRLDGHQLKVTCHGTYLTACCPAHHDRTPSLSVRTTHTLDGRGRISVKCWAGCTDEAVLAALGLKLADLYDEPRHAPKANRSYWRAKRARSWR